MKRNNHQTRKRGSTTDLGQELATALYANTNTSNSESSDDDYSVLDSDGSASAYDLPQSQHKHRFGSEEDEASEWARNDRQKPFVEN